ncbi:tail tape measure protein [Sphingomonas sp. KR1UV-12]|uniref:Tail tape measure protein n=1 Tax=Sphingomonas aurea TaxID=3063994 RepID=A0ABT9ELQ3_9SPHN|nr:tail tape measure protein [Sphingomonas sp. KR1UV-12]MDP1027785.1 tail tape measure protein [Sphingomonas sp. KR1UV-12]
MDDEFDRRLVEVRADTAGFARDVALMRETLDGGLGQGAARAGRAIETSLLAAVRSGRLGFEELRGVALKALDQIAAAGLRAGIDAVAGGGGGLGGLLARLLGAPGRATGGPVVGGRAYTVGERGPELFVPASSGRIEPAVAAGAREVRVAITVQAAGAGEAAGVLAQSSRQVARAVKAALEG